MSKLISFQLIITIFIFLSCAPEETSEDASAASQTKASNLKVAMVLPGDPQENPWSKIAYDSLLALKAKYKVQTHYSVETKTENAGEHFRKYAREGYDFILGHGTEYEKLLEKIAEEFPRTKFAITGLYPGNNRNLGSVGFRNSEMGYLAGAVAALKTKNGKVAFITGPANLVTRDTAGSFKKGALSVNPDIKVEHAFLDNWYDTENGEKTSKQWVTAGYDVIAHRTGTADQAILAVLKKAGIFTIGWDVDHHDLSPATAVTSCLQDFNLVVEQAFLLVQKGRWNGKLYKFGLSEGVQELAPFYGMLTAAQAITVQKIETGIIKGEIDPIAPIDP